MVLAMKCDICGELYKMYGNRTSEPNYNTLTLEKRTADDTVILDSIRRYDCCPKCTTIVLETIERLQQHGPTLYEMEKEDE